MQLMRPAKNAEVGASICDLTRRSIQLRCRCFAASGPQLSLSV